MSYLIDSTVTDDVSRDFQAMTIEAGARTRSRALEEEREKKRKKIQDEKELATAIVWGFEDEETNPLSETAFKKRVDDIETDNEVLRVLRLTDTGMKFFAFLLALCKTFVSHSSMLIWDDDEPRPSDNVISAEPLEGLFTFRTVDDARSETGYVASGDYYFWHILTRCFDQVFFYEYFYLYHGYRTVGLWKFILEDIHNPKPEDENNRVGILSVKGFSKFKDWLDDEERVRKDMQGLVLFVVNLRPSEDENEYFRYLRWFMREDELRKHLQDSQLDVPDITTCKILSKFGISFCLENKVEGEVADCQFYENLSYLKTLSRVATSIQNALNKDEDVQTFFTRNVNMRNVRPLLSNSASDSFMIEAFVSLANCPSLQDIRVIMKFSQMNPDLKREKDIYSCFVHNFKVPFFAYPYAINEHAETTSNFPIIRQITIGKRWSNRDIGFIMTEHCGSVTFFEYIDKSRYRDVNYYSGILQCIYALRYLRFQGIIHGDLHLKNIMFPTWTEIRRGEERSLFMNLNTGETSHDSESFENSLKLDRVIKIFDWDHGYEGMTDNYGDFAFFCKR